jgi:hypothetical protein
MICNSIQPQDWKRQIYRREGVDTPILLGVRYIGTSASGLVTVAATTGNLTFEHGVLSSEAADTTVFASTGILDLTTYDTLKKVLDAINASPNWEAWPIDFPGDFDMNISTNNGVFTVGGKTAAQAKTDAGLTASFVVDTNLPTAETHYCGVTWNGPSLLPHNCDAQVLHEVMRFRALATFAGATDGVYVYECDDIAGTKTQIGHFALVTATDTTFPSTVSDEPLFSVKGKRIVFKIADASGALTAVGTSSPCLEVFTRSYAFGPAIRANKMYSSF